MFFSEQTCLNLPFTQAYFMRVYKDLYNRLPSIKMYLKTVQSSLAILTYINSPDGPCIGGLGGGVGLAAKDVFYWSNYFYAVPGQKLVKQ